MIEYYFIIFVRIMVNPSGKHKIVIIKIVLNLSSFLGAKAAMKPQRIIIQTKIKYNIGISFDLL